MHGYVARRELISRRAHVVDGARAAFRNDLGDSSLVIGLACAAALAVIGLWVVTRTFQRESA